MIQYIIPNYSLLQFSTVYYSLVQYGSLKVLSYLISRDHSELYSGVKLTVQGSDVYSDSWVKCSAQWNGVYSTVESSIEYN